MAKNLLVMRPRRSHLIAEFKLTPDDGRQEEHEALGFDVLPYLARHGRYRLRLSAKDLDERKEELRRLTAEAEERYRSRAADS